MGVYVTPSGMKGVTNFDKIKKHITGFCLSHPYAFVTTMIDYYGLQKVVPALICTEGDIYENVRATEEKLEQELSSLNNLCINIVLHEFEGLLFSDVDAFRGIADKSQLGELRNIRRRVATPEHINDKYETAPSRRILDQIPEYSKIRDGVEVAQRIGIAKMMDECIHFGRWIGKLTAWAKEGV